MNRRLLFVATLLLSFVPASALPRPPQDGAPQGGDEKEKTRSLQPWQFRPDKDADKIRTEAIHLVQDIDVAMWQRYWALYLLAPQKVQSDDGVRSGPNDLAFSQVLSHVNQGAIWASLLLTIDSSLLSRELRDFRENLKQHLQDYSQLDSATLQRLAEEAKRHKATKKPSAADAIDAEIRYQADLSRLQTLFPDYARMFQYQSPRLLDRPGEPAMFALFDPLVNGLQPLRKGELMAPVFLVQVTQIGKAQFQIETYDVYREIWDSEGYVPRDPYKGPAAGHVFNLHNSPAFELNPNEAYVSRHPKEVLTLYFANGVPVVTGTSTPMVRESGVLQKVELPPGGFDPARLVPGMASAARSKELSQTQPPAAQPVVEAHAGAPPPASMTVPPPAAPAPAAVPAVHVPTTNITAIFRKDGNLVLAGTTPTSDEQAKVAKDVIDHWLAPYLLHATGPETDILRKALPNSDGAMAIYFSVSPPPNHPTDPPNIITSRTQSSLSVALPQEHYELPGKVLLDLVGVLTSNLPSQDKQSSEAVKRSLGKFLSSNNPNLNPNQPVPPDVLAKLGVESASSGKFITADIPEHPAGALGIYNPEEQGMAYRIIDFFNLLLRDADYLRRTGHTQEFQTAQKLLAALPDGLVVHFTIHKEDDPRPRGKRKEQSLPEDSSTDIYLSLPEHDYRPAKDDFQILRDALAEAIARSQPSGSLTGPEISRLLDDFLRYYSNDPHNQNNILTEVIKSLYTTS
jgi:hypothetical protein